MPAIISGDSEGLTRSKWLDLVPTRRQAYEALCSFLKNPVRRFSAWVFRKAIKETGPPSTFIRLLSSDHLNDLQWIGLGTIALWAIIVALVLMQASINTKVDLTKVDLNKPMSLVDYIITQHAVFGGITAVLGVVLSWIYQTGSKRLGVVDLFACEISAICRISLAVDFARNCVTEAEKELGSPVKQCTDLVAKASLASASDASSASRPYKFTSQEHYTPVYDGNLADLQPLEVGVVTYVTEFYSYRKAMIDCLRRIAAEEAGSNLHGDLRTLMIYMQFLMYESARHAVFDLIEFEPNREESIINILCSEMIVYDLLMRVFQRKGLDDYRYERLLIREKDYLKIVPDIYSRAVKASNHKNWEKAQTTAKELKRRYEQIFNVGI
jgi:hypothetical protein